MKVGDTRVSTFSSWFEILEEAETRDGCFVFPFFSLRGENLKVSRPGSQETESCIDQELFLKAGSNCLM